MAELSRGTVSPVRSPRFSGAPANLATQRLAVGWLLLAYVPVLIVLVALGMVTTAKGIPFSMVASDVAAIANLPFYAGVLSNIGILLWCTAAAVTLFSSVLLWRAGGLTPNAAFLLASGIFSATLLMDDFFLVHEDVFPYYLGLPQNLAIGAYGIGAAAWMIGFRRVIAGTDFLVLLIGVGFLGTSVVIDQLPSSVLPMHLFWEDGAKLLGITGWCVYLVRTALQFTHPAASVGN